MKRENPTSITLEAKTNRPAFCDSDKAAYLSVNAECKRLRADMLILRQALHKIAHYAAPEMGAIAKTALQEVRP